MVFSAMVYWMGVEREDNKAKEKRTASDKVKGYFGS